MPETAVGTEGVDEGGQPSAATGSDTEPADVDTTDDRPPTHPATDVEATRPKSRSRGRGSTRILGRLPRLRLRRPSRLPGWVLPAGIVAVVVALPVYGMWLAPGPPMEEGFMLVFPERVLAGDVPNRDFLHLYGPGSLWVLAGVFQLLGVDLWVERLVGLVQIVALVAAVTYVGLRWGRWVGVAGGVATAVVIMPAIGLTALAWVGGLALALWAVLVAVRALDSEAEDADDSDTDRRDRRRRRSLLLGGLLAGFALLYRPDLVIALALPFGAMWLWGLDRIGRRRLLGGVLVGVSPYLVHLAMAGPGNAIRGMVLEPIFDLRPGRSLNFPPSWSSYDSFLNKSYAWREWGWPVPTLPETNQIFLWVPLLFLVCAVLVGVAVHAQRNGLPEGWRLLVLALFVVGTLPQAVQRPDTAHLAWVGAVPFGLLPIYTAEWLRDREARRLAPRVLRITTLAPLLPLVLMLLVIPNFTVRWYADYVGQSLGYSQEGHPVEHEGRTFRHGREEAADATYELLADVERTTEPGDSLIVGPGSFRVTPYSEAHLYFLLPQLEPGTHYIEMDPGVANTDDSGLAEEVHRADVVILSTLYDDWDEPNTSRDPGSEEPDRVLAEEFCRYRQYGTNPAHAGRGFYELFLRRDSGHC